MNYLEVIGRRATHAPHALRSDVHASRGGLRTGKTELAGSSGPNLMHLRNCEWGGRRQTKDQAITRQAAK